jgi:Na+-driven multidrug efflux pump
VAVGAVLLVPLSPALIFGFGPLPRLGIVGGATAVVAYYAIGSLVFAAYIWSGRGVLKPSLRPPRLSWPPLREILRVGTVSSLISISTNLGIAVATGLTGLISPSAVAGYGTGARLEYLLVPLVFGLGAPLAAMVSSGIGADQRERALRAAWTGAAIAGGLTELIGVAAALFPHAWLSLFGHDPVMLAVGTQYLRTVGPFYGFFGFGLALYFASQGAGRLGWPALSALLRVTIAAGGGWLAVHLGGGLGALFLVIALSLVSFGGVNATAIAGGAWFGKKLGARVGVQPV